MEFNNSNDYNYRSLQKADTMYLSTINNKDINIKKFKQLHTNRDYSTNLFNLDIEGSSPRKYGAMCHKPDFTNRNDDIERSNPKVLHYPLNNKPDYAYNSRDIFGNNPSCVKFKTTRTPFNPLEPKYKLPEVEILDPPQPKFIRDNIQIKDIQGSYPKKYYKWQTRKGHLNDTIEGSSPKKPYERKTNYDYINYNDVTRDIFKTKRCVNPLDPIYEVKYKNNENYVHGAIEKSKPQTNYPYSYANPTNLKCNDIDGCYPGSKNKISKFQSVYNHNLNTKDIPGAVSGSLRKGIKTERNTNPIWPKYNYIGQKELGNKYTNDPYASSISKEINIKKTTDYDKGLKETEVDIKIVKDKKENNDKIECKEIKENKDNKRSLINVDNNNSNTNKLCKQVCDDFNENNTKAIDKNIGYIYNKPEFNPERFKKPDPYFSYIHDSAIIPAIDPLKKDLYSNKNCITDKKTLKSSLNNNKINSGNSITNKNFLSNLTNAEKLDSFITYRPN